MDYKMMAKGFLGAIQEYGDVMQTKADIEGRRAKLTSDMIANEFKAKQNFFWKQKEQEAQNQSTINMMNKYNNPQGGSNEYGAPPYAPTPNDGSTMPGTQAKPIVKDVFDMPIKPELRIGAEGKAIPHYPTKKEFWLSGIQEKAQKGLQLSKREQAFMNKEMGIKEETNLFADEPNKDVPQTPKQNPAVVNKINEIKNSYSPQQINQLLTEAGHNPKDYGY